MKIIFALVSFFMISFAVIAKEKVVLKDVYLFKVLNTPKTYQDIRSGGKLLESFNCLYKDSFLIKIFKTLLKEQKRSSFFKQMPNNLNLSQKDKKLIQRFIRFYKFLSYVDSYVVPVDKTLPRGLYLMGLNKKCSLVGFKTPQAFTENFSQIVKAEVFLRTRFAEKRKGKVQTKNLIESADVFVDSVSKQISEVFFFDS